MTPRKVFLDELTTSSKNYKVKAKVISKDRPQEGQQTKLRYQGLVLQDEKGTKMRGALFGDQIQNFRDAIVYNGTYEISNATIKPMEERWKRDPSELNFQMGFNPNTLIQPMDTEQGPALPEYRAIGQIPKRSDPSEKIDVVGILMFVEDKPRQVRLPEGRKIDVTEIILMDHSTQQPLTVSAWGDLAEIASETLPKKTDSFKVVGFTALKVAYHKGFSMSTTMSSEIVEEPIGERAVNLENWCKNNTQKLMEIKTRILNSKHMGNHKFNITIAALRLKRATNTLQDDRYWLRVKVPEAEFTKLSAYLGCSKCGKPSDQPPESVYTCGFCSKDNCVSIPRVTFSCEIVDATSSLPITVYTENAEKLFRLTAQDIFRIKHSGDAGGFETARKLMSTTTYLVEVGPKRSLSLSNVLEWIVKQVEVEVEAPDGKDRPEVREDSATPLKQTPKNQVNLDTGLNESSQDTNATAVNNTPGSANPRVQEDVVADPNNTATATLSASTCRPSGYIDSASGNTLLLLNA